MRGLAGNRDYRLWWAGSLVSGIGTAMSLVAYPLLVLAITGSPLRAGLVGALEAAPYAALSLPAGVLADRVSRRALLTTASFASVAATGWVPLSYWLGVLDVRQIYLTAVVNGTAGVVFEVTQVATVPRLVTEDQLGVAAGQAELIFNLSAIAGPPLAGLLLTAWLALPMLVDAVSFAVVGCVILAIRARLSATSAPPPVPWRRDLTTGMRIVAGRRQLRSMSILTITGDMLFAGIAVLMTVLLRHSGATPSVVGLNFSLAAAGGVAGSLAASRVERRFGLVTAIVSRSWATAALFPLLAVAGSPFLLGGVWCALNVMIALMNVVQMRYVMATMPNEILGRAQSFLTFLSYGVLPVGALLTGFLLEVLGPARTVFCFSAVLGLLAIYASVSPGLRDDGGPARSLPATPGSGPATSSGQ
jgi:MFS family permease